MSSKQQNNGFSRRNFIKSTAAISAAATLAGSSRLFAAGSDKLRVGLIGCGGRGTAAVQDILRASKSAEVVALGDLYEDRLQQCLKDLKTNGGQWAWNLEGADVSGQVSVSKDACFTGFDNYKGVIAQDIDVVILATPPHFRADQLKAAVDADKHIFMEKPVATDPVHIRSIIKSAEQAEKKGLCIVAGTQRRHQNYYLETMKRIHDGQIGDIVAGQCYWNQGGMGNYWKYYPREGRTSLDYQCRNWPYYVWLSGDHYVEQHVHNIDVINWAIGSHPVQAMGMGGRAARTEARWGNIWDHFAVEYEYPNGTRVMSMARQIEGCPRVIGERLVGTKGTAYTDEGGGEIIGKNSWKYTGKRVNPYLQEQKDFVEAIRSGNILNEGKRVAQSTMTAIMGRISAYTGRTISWNWIMNGSKLDLAPDSYDNQNLPIRPVRQPGKTQLI